MLLGAALSCVARQAGAAGVDPSSYQIPFPPSPASGVAALTTLDQRAEQLLSAYACGSDIEFAMIQHEARENTTAYLVAKMDWAMGHPDGQGVKRIDKPCAFRRYFTTGDLCRQVLGDNDPRCSASSLAAVREIFRPGFARQYFPHASCGGQNATILLVELPPERTPRAPEASNAPNVVAVDFLITQQCLMGQINASLLRMSPIGQMGTDKAPCHLTGATEGDWDMQVVNLTRLAFLNERAVRMQGAQVIAPDALKNLEENLLTAAGGPAPESYSPMECGNTEESTGSSQERADERDWTDAPFWKAIGDILWFLFLLLLIVFLAYLIALAIVTFLGAVGGGIVVGLIAVGAAVIVVVGTMTGIVAETENHLLMINSSKYLKNQTIIADVAPDDNGANRYRQDQGLLKEWLLRKMQSVFQKEFIEYNSRPYHRLSIFALHNLADFSDDDELRSGARLVLDLTTAKFAVTSQQGRRFAPFRRKRENMAARIDVGSPERNGLFDLLSGGDHQIGLGLLYAGQVDQMRDNYVSFGAAAQTLFAATSLYHPEDFVVDLAIRKDAPVFQRMLHATAEAYASGRSYLISAGGVPSGLAYGAPVSDAAAIRLLPRLRDDLGLALPTTLFLSKSPLDDPENVMRADGTPQHADPFAIPSMSRTTLDQLIRIEGHRPTPGDAYPSYDQNLCIWDGFACGINVVIPGRAGSVDTAAGFLPSSQLLGEAGPCLDQGGSGTPSEWSFIDSRRCAAYRSAPRFFIAVYRQSCPALTTYCQDNFGFFEIVDADATDDFNAFKARVTAANPPGFVDTGSWVNPVLKGTYHSARGQKIEFLADSGLGRSAGVIAVDGVAQNDYPLWPSAGGSSPLPPGTTTPISSSGDGRVLVRNARAGKTLDLDFRDYAHPKRSVK